MFYTNAAIYHARSRGLLFLMPYLHCSRYRGLIAFHGWIVFYYVNIMSFAYLEDLFLIAYIQDLGRLCLCSGIAGNSVCGWLAPLWNPWIPLTLRERGRRPLQVEGSSVGCDHCGLGWSYTLGRSVCHTVALSWFLPPLAASLFQPACPGTQLLIQYHSRWPSWRPWWSS